MLIYLADELSSNLKLGLNIKQVNFKHINVFIMNKSREYKTQFEYMYTLTSKKNLIFFFVNKFIK